ncbi:MAG: hypothetical protein HQM13_23145 [SAR324 cluster bacterium]|nr:hypothetical protein [SAR324 cluster bacterium]
MLSNQVNEFEKDHQADKYGAFWLKDGIGYWNQDDDVQIKMMESPSDSCQLEGFWNPNGKELQAKYTVAMSGLCIWSKYDCVFKFESRSKGNPGAERSLSSPKDRVDLLKRLSKGHKVEQITVSSDPFGLYQSKIIGWQSDTVCRFGVQKLYYALPIEEYRQTLNDLEKFLSKKWVGELSQMLKAHHEQLEEKIKSKISAEVEFIHPMQFDNTMTIEESYVWPYQNLDIDLGIEEMEEIRIPYQAMKLNSVVPPILLGMLGTPCPYYERRADQKETNFLRLFL